MDTDLDLLVVGGGISGLAMAHLATAAGWRVTLLEAAPQLGGCVRTHRFAEAEGLWLELGAHTLFNSYGRLLGMAEAAGLGAADRLTRRRLPFLLWDAGRAIPVWRRLEPFGLLAGTVRLPFLRKADHTVDEYFGALAGRRNFRRVLGPALDAVACQPVAGFPADQLFRPKPRRRDLPRSFTWRGGLSRLTEALAATAGSLLTGIQVERIYRQGRTFVASGSGEQWRAPRLALAVPPPEASRLLERVLPEVAAAVAPIGLSMVESVGVVAPTAAVALPPLAGLIGRESPFFSVVSRDVVPDGPFRGFTFHFRPGRLDADGQRAVAAEVLGVAEADLTAIARTEHRLPALARDHAERVATIDAQLTGRPLAIIGNWLGGLSLEDCALRAWSEFERLRRTAI